MCLVLTGVWYLCVQATSCHCGEQPTFLDQPSPVQPTGDFLVQSWTALSSRRWNSTLVRCGSPRGSQLPWQNRWSVSDIVLLLCSKYVSKCIYKALLKQQLEIGRFCSQLINIICPYWCNIPGSAFTFLLRPFNLRWSIHRSRRSIA